MHKIFIHSFGAVVAVLAVALAAPAQQAAKQVRIGDYSIAPYGTLRVAIKPGGGYDATLIGEAGRTMLASSPEYDITAARMEITTARVAGKQKATRFVTTGSTKVVNRNRVNNQKTVITCGAMRYAATTAPADRGVMRLLGGVRSETTDPALAAPLVLTGDTGTATFQTDGTILVTMDASGGNGSLSGKVYEAVPKGKKP